MKDTNTTMTTSRLAVAALLGFALASVPACKKPAPAPTADPSGTAAAQAAIPTRFARVEARKLDRSLEVSGTLDADERSEVAAQTGGAVLKVLIDSGSRVKKGDVLVELDGREASLRVATANATAKQQLARLGIERGQKFDPEAVADVRSAREARDLAVLEYDRAKRLFDAGGVTQAALDQAKSGAERARAQYDAARNGAEQAWAGLAAAEAQARLSAKGADDTRIRAPFDGAVVEKRIAPGEYAQPGRVVAVLVRDNPLRLRIDVPEADVGGVAEGRAVELKVAAHPGRTFQGVIKRIGASVKVQSRTLPVEAEVPNDQGILRPGFFATARVALAGEATDALVVPKAAIGTSGSSSRVFVRSGNRVAERLVTVGRDVGELVEVRGAIKEGDEVAVDAIAELSDSAEIAAR